MCGHDVVKKLTRVSSLREEEESADISLADRLSEAKEKIKVLHSCKWFKQQLPQKLFCFISNNQHVYNCPLLKHLLPHWCFVCLKKVKIILPIEFVFHHI